jgi:hypothetical protein
MPGAPTDWCEDQRLMIDLTAQGEQFSSQVATADDDTDDLDLAWSADEFYRRLQNWIAESRFGWGLLRGGHRHPPAPALRAGAGGHPTPPTARTKQRGTVCAGGFRRLDAQMDSERPWLESQSPTGSLPSKGRRRRCDA